MVPVSKLSGLGSVIGYLLAGVLIGPFALGLVSDPETVLHFSEFGVVMMLFIIGLELQPKELWNMRGKLLGFGAVQVIVTAVILFACALLLGRVWGAAAIIALALALSSTAIAIQIMQERGLMGTQLGKAGFSVLLFQDIAVIPIIALIPVFAAYSGLPDMAADIGHAAGDAASHGAGHGDTDNHGSGPQAPKGWYYGLAVIGVFAGMILGGRLLLRPLFRMVAKAGVREIFTAMALLLVVGAALLMDWLGLSAALGAFIAGVVLADSEYRHQLERDIEPFKALLLGLFFISVGMSVNFAVLAENPFGILGMVAGLVGIKFAVLWIIAKRAKLERVSALMFAAILSQGGEFAFVLFQYALAENAMLPTTASTLNAVVAVSMATTPLLLILIDKVIAPRLSQNQRSLEMEAMPDDMKPHVIVIGFGRVGQVITRMLGAQGFEITIIDHDPDHIEFIKQFGYKVYYGSALDMPLLHTAGASGAALIVLAIDDRARGQKSAEAIKHEFPHTKLMARARNRQHLFDLRAIEVDYVERETFRSSLHMGEEALRLLGMEDAHIREIGAKFKALDLAIVEEQLAVKDDMPALIKTGIRGRVNLEETLKADQALRARKKGEPEL